MSKFLAGLSFLLGIVLLVAALLTQTLVTNSAVIYAILAAGLLPFAGVLYYGVVLSRRLDDVLWLLRERR